MAFYFFCLNNMFQSHIEIFIKVVQAIAKDVFTVIISMKV